VFLHERLFYFISHKETRVWERMLDPGKREEQRMEAAQSFPDDSDMPFSFLFQWQNK
jgi:hypothetical protein